MRHPASPIGMAAPAQKPNWYTRDELPSEELPSMDCAASMVPTKNRGRLFPATMYRLLLFFTILEVSVPTTRERPRKAIIAIAYPSSPAIPFYYIISKYI